MNITEEQRKKWNEIKFKKKVRYDKKELKRVRKSKKR